MDAAGVLPYVLIPLALVACVLSAAKRSKDDDE